MRLRLGAGAAPAVRRTPDPASGVEPPILAPMPLDALLSDIAAFSRACASELQHEPRPVVRVSPETRLLIAGQAPPAGGCMRAGCRSTIARATCCAARSWGSTARPSTAIGASASRPWHSAFQAQTPRAATILPPRRCAELRKADLLASPAEGGTDPARWELRPSAGPCPRPRTARMTNTVAGWRAAPAGDDRAAASLLAQHRLAEAQSLVRGRGACPSCVCGWRRCSPHDAARPRFLRS